MLNEINKIEEIVKKINEKKVKLIVDEMEIFGINERNV